MPNRRRHGPNGRWVPRAFVILATTMALLIATAGQAAAAVPVLSSAITDQTGLLADGTSQIQSAQKELFAASGVQLYVLFVNTTDGQEISQYALAVGNQNSLGAKDALLVVAINDRTDWLQLGPGLRDSVSQNTIDSIISDLESSLQSSDFVGGVVGVATGLQAVVPPITVPATAAPTPAPKPTPSATEAPGASTGGDGGSGLNLLPILVGILLIGAGLWLVLRMRRERNARQAAFKVAAEQEHLGREANALLIQTDDAVRDAQQQRRFVQSEFGSAQAAALTTALDGAKEDLRQAFTLGQELDDTVPDPPDKRRQMIQDLIDHTKRAQATLDAQRATIAKLRDIEKNVESVLAALPAQIEQVKTRIPAATQDRARLDKYAPDDWKAVAGNLAAVDARLASAETHHSNGLAAVTANDRVKATSEAMAAQADVAEAGTLLDAIGQTAASLDDVAGKVPAELDAVARDLDEARPVVTAASPQDRQNALKQADAALAAARAAAAGTAPDVIGAMRQATAAAGVASQLLAGVRAEAVQAQRSLAAANTAIASAQASIQQADAYVTSHRRTEDLGRRARNRVDDARRYLAQATANLNDQPHPGAPGRPHCRFTGGRGPRPCPAGRRTGERRAGPRRPAARTPASDPSWPA